MEIACVIDSRLATPARPGRSGGPRPGRNSFPIRSRRRSGPRRWCGALEGIGAAVESERAGEAFFAVDGLRGIHGGEQRRGAGGGARGRSAAPVRIGVAPTRFAAFAAAGRARRSSPRRRLRGFLAPLPVAVLPPRLGPPGARPRSWSSPWSGSASRPWRRSRASRADQVADRFGPLGLRALRLARGEDEPLRPRRPHEELAEQIELPEGTAGQPARPRPRAARRPPARRAAAPRAGPCSACASARCSAPAAAGASSRGWAGRAPRPGSCARCWCRGWRRCRARPTALRLRALGLGPPVGDQLELSVGGEEPRRRRLGEAVREVRAAQGAEALLRVLPVDSASRVPERWAMLTPFPEL